MKLKGLLLLTVKGGIPPSCERVEGKPYPKPINEKINRELTKNQITKLNKREKNKEHENKRRKSTDDKNKSLSKCPFLGWKQAKVSSQKKQIGKIKK